MKKFAFWGGLSAAYVLFLRPQMMKWGTRLGESQRRLPGDEIIPQTNFRATRAIDIDAPPEMVWSWLAQMGRERTGWYSMDLLKNDGIPSATYIRSDVPLPQVGMETGLGYEIFKLEPERLLVFAGFAIAMAPGIIYDLTRSYLLEQRAGGERSRLLVRTRGYAYGLIGLVYTRLFFEVFEFIFVRQQLLNLRARAESCMEAPGAPGG